MSDDLNDPSFLKTIGQRLKAARQSVGLSQRDVCAALGVGTSAWNHWETGRRSPDLMTLIRFSKTYSISTDWILGGEPPDAHYTSEQRIAIGHRLSAVRQALDLSLEDFAAAIEVELPALTRWETGEDSPNLHAMFRMAKRFSVTLDWIFLGDPAGLPHRIAGKTLKAVS
ncbi:MAG: helix-turn-helix transcriptional regulator [Magnetococcales bacterium]|nr:helix-turn-helix transcriptional regulator [Magnetococcales bacterium]